jgi:hypothetical protein
MELYYSKTCKDMRTFPVTDVCIGQELVNVIEIKNLSKKWGKSAQGISAVLQVTKCIKYLYFCIAHTLLTFPTSFTLYLRSMYDVP